MDEIRRKRWLLVILYLGFISLGLPDTVLGVAWPEMRRDFFAPLEWAGWLMSLTTVVSVLSSLTAVWLMKRCHAGIILTASALMTSAAMLGYSLAPGLAAVAAFTLLFGVGQGAVDTAVNAHMAKNYSSRHMNWIHGYWGVGATGGPLVFTAAFGLGLYWRAGYMAIFAIQLTLGLIFLFTLKLWREPSDSESRAVDQQKDTNCSRGGWNPVRAYAGVAFYFCYPGVEIVTGLWGASYLVEVLGAPPSTAGAALTMYWGSLMAGRFAVGFIAGRYSNSAIMRGGLGLAALGLIMAALASGAAAFAVALGLLGLGLSPLYPTMMHETPQRTGTDRSDRIIGFQVGAALAGAAVLPILAGLLIRHLLSLASLPRLLMFMAILLIAAHELSVGRQKAEEA